MCIDEPKGLRYIIAMAFDGSVIACITKELNQVLPGSRITKIAQPEKDGLLLTIKKDKDQYRLLLSVNPSLPLIYFTKGTMESPLAAPSFCMLLRKHLSGGKIKSVSQPSLERIIQIEVEHMTEMGDLSSKTLIIELMGKHSNIIFAENGVIIDSIKHISSLVSSVREVLPGRPYFIPFSDQKLDPFTVTAEEFKERFHSCSLTAAKAIYTNITGFSPDLSEEILLRANVDSDRPANSLSQQETETVYKAFSSVMQIITSGDFAPNIIYEKEEPVKYAPFQFQLYKQEKIEFMPSISDLLYKFYSEKQQYTAIKQKTADLRQIVNTLLNKDYKKYDLQIKQVKDTEKKETYRIYGDLLMTYGYQAEPKATFIELPDFESGKTVRIPLDPTLSAIENAKRYYNKYAKMKRTALALDEILLQTKAEIDHLESIAAALETIKDQADIYELKKEMTESGYIKSSAHDRTGKSNPSNKRAKNKGPQTKSKPLHYISSDGFDIYVGKNNYQNEYISFQLAEGNDWWFHAKKIPGSHVIVRAFGNNVPDSTMEEAARLAAHYSKACSRDASASDGKVEIDYVERKFLKKTPGGKPGFVIYHKNYSMQAGTDISDIKEVTD